MEHLTAGWQAADDEGILAVTLITNQSVFWSDLDLQSGENSSANALKEYSRIGALAGKGENHHRFPAPVFPLRPTSLMMLMGSAA